MSKYVYIVRHGESSFNEGGKLGGDPDLTEKGKEHVRHLVEVLSELNIKRVYTSEKIRCSKTAEIICKELKVSKLIRTPALKNLDKGFFNALTHSDVEKRFPHVYEQRKIDKFNTAFPGGESYADVTKRIVPFFEKLKVEEPDLEGNAVIVGHKSAIRAMLGHLMSLPERESPHLIVPFDAVYEVDLTNFKNVCYVNGDVRQNWYPIQ